MYTNKIKATQRQASKKKFKPPAEPLKSLAKLKKKKKENIILKSEDSDDDDAFESANDAVFMSISREFLQNLTLCTIHTMNMERDGMDKMVS